MAHTVSKSKAFQYSTGIFLSVFGGLLLLSYYLIHRFILKKGGKGLSIGTAVATTGYGWSFLYFVRTHLRHILIHHWEIVAGYLAFMSLLGIIAVRMIRSNDKSKNTTREVTKWLLRFIALTFVYNSNASPSGSLAVMIALGALFGMQKLIAPTLLEKQ